MRLLALVRAQKDRRIASRAQLAAYRWLTRLGHIVSLVAVVSLSAESDAAHNRMPHVAIGAPFALRQLVRLVLDTGANAIVGAGDPAIDSLARDACDVLGIPFLASAADAITA